MKKKFAAVSVMVLTLMLTNCSSSTAKALQLNTPTTVSKSNSNVDFVQELFKNAKISSNTKKIHKVINRLEKRIGKTWYVFSGSTPSGWDCSGLVMWTYENLGVTLEHSASVQKNSGKRVKTPKPGDIVAFGWKGYRGAQHVGIYIGKGKMIHAGGGPGQKTEVVNIKDWAGGSYSQITYTRIINTI